MLEILVETVLEIMRVILVEIVLETQVEIHLDVNNTQKEDDICLPYFNSSK